MILAIPTDTCFGLACSIKDKAGFFDIYNLKGRSYEKPLSIVVKNFEDLSGIIEITENQIGFLKNYQFPFTILGEKNKNFLLPNFLDKNKYSRIAVRVADICITKNVAKELEFPLFLTSANLSGEEEIFDSDEIIKNFGNEKLKIFTGKIGNKPASDIFEFLGKTLEIKYLRKNY